MPLLNYTAKVPAERTIGEVMRLLVSKGAREIITVYDDAGVPSGLKWRVESRHGPLAYALPCNIDQVYARLTERPWRAGNERQRG